MTVGAVDDVYWDSCVLIRWLTGYPADYKSDLRQFVREAKTGKVRIHISTVTLSEISSGHIAQADYGDIHALLDDLRTALYPVTPSPPIMVMAGQLRSNTFERDKGRRVVSVPDAIHLATAVHIRDELGVADLVMHSFDQGKNNGPEGKCVPIIGFENWTARCSSDALVQRVLALPRQFPTHPNRELFDE